MSRKINHISFTSTRTYNQNQFIFCQNGVSIHILWFVSTITIKELVSKVWFGDFPVKVWVRMLLCLGFVFPKVRSAFFSFSLHISQKEREAVKTFLLFSRRVPPLHVMHRSPLSYSFSVYNKGHSSVSYANGYFFFWP